MENSRNAYRMAIGEISRHFRSISQKKKKKKKEIQKKNRRSPTESENDRRYSWENHRATLTPPDNLRISQIFPRNFSLFLGQSFFQEMTIYINKIDSIKKRV